MSKYNNVGNIFSFNCVDCEYNRNCYGGNLGNQYRFCQKSREKLEDFDKLQQENQELKKQLENCYCNRTDCSSRIKDSKQYDSLVQKVESQQKMFIEYLEEPIKIITDGNPTNISEYTAGKLDALKEILSKYKEIIGVDD